MRTKIFSSFRALVATVGTAITVGGAAPWPAAAAEGSKGKDGAGVWLMCYAVVFLFVVLGLMFLLRPSGRRDRPKMEL